jgi:hypothetical protein
VAAFSAFRAFGTRLMPSGRAYNIMIAAFTATKISTQNVTTKEDFRRWNYHIYLAAASYCFFLIKKEGLGADLIASAILQNMT